MAKDKASTRKPRRRNARARDDGGTRRATEATPPVRASKRLSVQVSAAASAFLVNFRLGSAIASIFVNYHEEREALVEKTEAADLIEQNVAEMMGSTSQIADEGGPATHQLVAATVIPDRSAARAARSPRNRRAPAAASPAQLLIQFVVLPRKMGTGRDSLESDENVVTCFIDAAATLKRARKQGLLRPVAPRPLNARVARRRRRFERLRSSSRGRPVTGRSSFRDPSESIPDDLDPVARRLQFDFVLMLCRRLGVKDVFLFATEAGAPAWLTLGFEHVGSSASLIHLRFDLLFKRDRGVLARSARGRGVAPRSCSMDARSRSSATPRASTPWSAVQERVAEYGEKQVVRLAKEAANAAARRGENGVGARVSTDAPEHDSLAAPSPPRASSAPAPAAPSPPARGTRANASSPPRRRRRPGRGAPRGRAAGAGAAPPRRRRRGWEESDEDDPVEDLIHRERIRERDLLRTPGCLALGRKAFRLEDMPRVTERDREILRRVLYILREAERPSTRSRSTRTSSSRVDMEVRRSTVGVYEDSLACQLLGQTYYVHPDKTIKITVDLVVTSEVIGAFSVCDGRPSARSFSLAGTAPSRAEVQIKELGFHFVDPLAPIAEKEIVPRVRVFIPYLGIEGWISITLDDGHLIVELKYLQAMHLDMALLARPTLAGVIRKFANAIARKAAEARGETFVPTPYDETAVDAVVVTAVPPVAPVVAPEPAPPAVAAMDAKSPRPSFALATLVADGAKKVVFQYGRPGNGTDYLVARWRGLARRTRCASSSTSSRGGVAAAAADELPVDRLQRAPDPGLVNMPTIWPRMRFPVRVATSRRRATEALSRVQERFYGITDFHVPEGKFQALAQIPGSGNVSSGRIVFGTYDSKVEVAPPRPRSLERYKADFALQLKDLAYVEAADEAYLRDQAAALAPPEPMPDGSRPPIDAHSRRVARASRTRQPRRVAKLYVVPNCEVVTPPPPPIYHVTENGERLLVLYATCSGR
ncbi:hypothetical protein JL722_14051 [Aureococcus anophagefferens]|nr:hypothetical protein JL722_14051 [Aureococcus anophagefferens]